MSRNRPGEQASCERLGANLIKAREDKGLTPKQLAEAAELDPRTVKRIETAEGWARLTTLWLLADALNLDAGILVDGIEWSDADQEAAHASE